MKDPVLVPLAVVFVLLGASAVYFLVRGLRKGRFADRFAILAAHRALRIPNRAVSEGYEPGYSYRDRDGVGFWLGAAVQALILVICATMFIVLVAAP
ncbi:MAG: hypothetical protein WDM91_04490 [Rhizomicrobium sp.]